MTVLVSVLGETVTVLGGTVVVAVSVLGGGAVVVAVSVLGGGAVSVTVESAPRLLPADGGAGSHQP